MDIDICHWCEMDMTRANSSQAWVSRYGETECEFHPAAYDSDRLKKKNEQGVHQNLYEVHDIIAKHYLSQKYMETKTMRVVTSNVVITSSRSRITSRNAAEKFLPRSGTIRKQVYDLIKQAGDYGRTDFELEGIMKGKHQTVSASRRSLVVDGWLVDSGKTRINSQGNDCIVWVEKDTAFKETLFA